MTTCKHRQTALEAKSVSNSPLLLPSKQPGQQSFNVIPCTLDFPGLMEADDTDFDCQCSPRSLQVEGKGGKHPGSGELQLLAGGSIQPDAGRMRDFQPCLHTALPYSTKRPWRVKAVARKQSRLRKSLFVACQQQGAGVAPRPGIP